MTKSLGVESNEPALITEPIRGYRAFTSEWRWPKWPNAIDNDKRDICAECWPTCGRSCHYMPLRSVYAEYNFMPGINVAGCTGGIVGASVGGGISSSLHPTFPQPMCTCGFYATHSGFPVEYLNRMVLGSVKATGRVIVGSLGFRAEKVEIEAIACGYDTPLNMIQAALELWGERYSVPIFQHPQELLEAFPPNDLSNLIPPAEPTNYDTWNLLLEIKTQVGPMQLRQNPKAPNDVVLVNYAGHIIMVPANSYEFFRFSVQDPATTWTIEITAGKAMLVGRIERSK